jgi:hypothetical protein
MKRTIVLLTEENKQLLSQALDCLCKQGGLQVNESVFRFRQFIIDEDVPEQPKEIA